MSSRNGSEPVEPTRPVRRATPTSTDPEVLVAGIERTREELAETFDAIADRVSPKRVADRTRRQVAEVVTVVREMLAEQVGVARGKANEVAAGAKDVAAGAKDRVSGASGAHAGSAARAAGPVQLPPVKAVQAVGLDLSLPARGSAAASPTGTPTSPTSPTGPGTPGIPPSPLSTATGPSPELLAGGALGLLVLLLLRRRRAKRKALKKGALAALAGAGAEMRSDFDKARKKGRKRR